MGKPTETNCIYLQLILKKKSHNLRECENRIPRNMHKSDADGDIIKKVGGIFKDSFKAPVVVIFKTLSD